MKRKTFEEELNDYWAKHYVNRTVLMCCLCGNTGEIDTRQTAVSPAGVKTGMKTFCICPNGRDLRK